MSKVRKDLLDVKHLRVGKIVLDDVNSPPVTKSGVVTTDNDGYARVAFSTPYTAGPYNIALGVFASPWPYMASVTEIGSTGFDVYTRKTAGNGVAYPNAQVSWVATPDFNP